MSSDLGFAHQWVPAPDPDAPTLLLLHGTGGNEHDLVALGRQLAPRANLLSPRGKVLENGMPRFFRRLAEGVFDVPDLKARALELADFVAAASRAYGFDAARVHALGYSNGANIASAVLLLRPEALAGAALLRAVVPFEAADVPDLRAKGVLILAGRRDPYSRSPVTETLAGIFQRAGADVQVHWAEAGHELTQVDLLAARDWLGGRLR